MSTVYYENINVRNFKLLLAYTKENVVRLEFNTGSSSEKSFLNSLCNDFRDVIKNDLRCDFTLTIEDYLNSKSRDLNVPVKLIGTDFNKRVWEHMMKIPYGELRSYGELAKAVGNEKASRAVGNANNKNKIVLIVPCHRVIGSNNNLVGFAPGLEYKVELLEMEGHKIIQKQKSKLFYVDR
jgi:methylated-DNA-[protein]-cysteine S-methyltransferase